ncbi:MAG TPA: amino acid permease [Burkholderiales bacterium]|nr:amino acid permease [Burkholderiales bacterium]
MKKASLIKNILFGRPLNLLNPKIKEHIALVSIMAWLGLGADGLSSSLYGPEFAYLALGSHTKIAIYLSFATAITVFLIALSYNQVIELFPNGGGGYKVATHLLGPYAGLISGSALIIDYILTIAVSIASGTDALFNLLPVEYSSHKVLAEIFIIVILITINLRGVKESIIILLPIFAGFFLTHLAAIIIGITYHSTGIINILPEAAKEAQSMSNSIGLFAAIALFLRAYSLGGGTYTGLEAVSNNVNMLAEPKIRTGKLTMWYMAISLAITAGGIILLFLLWNATPEPGKTLNGIVFNNIINEVGLSKYWLPIILFFEAAILFLAANTGFLGCPAVMANMAVDKWLPRQFRELSNRLVTQNGILISGIASIIILIWANGRVSTLVILYSINVFLTFSMALLGLCVYWIRSRKIKSNWWSKLTIALIGLIACSFILLITILEKFTDGGWLTLLITACVISFCILVRKHYHDVGVKLSSADTIFASHFKDSDLKNQTLIEITDKSAKTAVFFVTKHLGVGLHTLLWVRKLFPHVYKNYVFLTAGEVDSEVFAKDEIYNKKYRHNLHTIVEKYRYFCTEHNLPSEGLFSYGVDEIKELLKLAEYVQLDYPDCVFFASKLVFVDESWWTRLLHNNSVIQLQRELHLNGSQMVILPMKI